jgi:DNA helicase-2/ATP-dependent DNA helicase PcrA
VERLENPAHETVEWLIDDLDYETHIRQRSAFEETAERRVNTARSLVEFARGHKEAVTRALGLDAALED